MIIHHLYTYYNGMVTSLIISSSKEFGSGDARYLYRVVYLLIACGTY